ncbi:cytochrome P450 [Saccharothrix sp. BKS2]|uniref:cytochrome P450 n=1 Tax=Saccharothrix sp. BKS2 TaxID=3064400 RepID=UPI0039EBFDE5
MRFAGRVRGVVKPVVRWGVQHGLPRAALLAAARRGDPQARLFVASNELPTGALSGLFDEIRGGGPLVEGAFSKVTASHAVVREVLTSNDFRSGIGAGTGVLARLAEWSAPEALHPMVRPSLLVAEPPDHTRYRRLVTGVFTARAVEGLRGLAERTAHELLDALDPRRPVDLAGTYCALLPVTMISEVLGVPPEQRRRVLELGAAAAPSLDTGLSWGRFRRVDAALVAFDAWLAEHLGRLRARPGEDLLSRLVAAREDGVGLSEVELRATAGLVLAAGFETTVNLLGNGIALLHDHPGQLAVVRRDPARWSNAVEEVLRVDPPVLLTGRTCVRDTEVAGVPVAAGSLVTAVLAGANRDPLVFGDPGRFDVCRVNAREHIAFSAGRHHCLGAALARLEGEVGLRVLFERFPGLRLLPGAVHRSTRVLRGYERLPAVLGG